MIRSALLIITCCLLQLSSSAQSKWQVGIRAGASVAYNNLSIDVPQESIITRYNLGGLLLSIPIEYQYTDMFSFVSSLSYLQKGTSIELRESNASTTFQNTFVIDYLQVPLRGKLALQLNRFQLYLSGGFFFAYATDLKRITYIGVETTQTTKLDFRASQVRRFDLGLQGGGGLQVNVANGKLLFVELLFNAGVVDIDQHPAREVYNQGYLVSMGMMVPVGKK